MAGHALAWIAYIPIPGAALLAVRTAPDDRLVRFHARQGTAITLFLYLMLLLFGLLALAMPATSAAVGPAAGAVLAVALLCIIVGVTGAVRGRFTRIRPFWDLLAH